MNSDTPISSIELLVEAYHTLIPISQHMGITVDAYDGNSLTIKAPLENNINHQNSAFGGSLFSLAALAGWGIIQLKLSELNLSANTVIAGGDVSYSAPVFEELVCQCRLPDEYDTFVDRLKSKGRASITLQSNFMVDASIAMAFSGRYVVLPEGQ
ncbi:MAG: YiiD C-terminal domain-containing protein [bacterium]|nr:hypothetical protein [Gammaproteobacteria bacterium]HIL95095.1 hypothetical protein [Pseudomonadales bacterium]